MKIVMYASRHENNAAFAHLMFLGVDAHESPAANYVIHFVFVVRLLRICAARWQDVETGTHRRHAKKFFVQLATLGSLLVDFGKIGEKRFQAKIPPKMSSVNCGIRLCVCRSPSGLYHW